MGFYYMMIRCRMDIIRIHENMTRHMYWISSNRDSVEEHLPSVSTKCKCLF